MCSSSSSSSQTHRELDGLVRDTKVASTQPEHTASHKQQHHTVSKQAGLARISPQTSELAHHCPSDGSCAVAAAAAAAVPWLANQWRWLETTRHGYQLPRASGS
jgi:hypothetical protein